MARPNKNTVDYFPHQCSHGKTMFILEQRYGNDGYAFLFKLLEELGLHDGHYIDLREETELEFLAAKTRFTAEKTIEVLNLLSKLGTIDEKLWTSRIVWCEHLVDNIKDAYRKRSNRVPSKPVIGDDNQVSSAENEVNSAENTQTKLNETKDINNNKNWDNRIKLHDGTEAIMYFGKWVDPNNKNVAIDVGYYPELKPK